MNSRRRVNSDVRLQRDWDPLVDCYGERMKALAALNTSLFVICVFASVAVSGGSYLSTQSTPKAYREALLTAMNSKLHAKSYRLKEIQSGAGEGVAVSTVTMGDYVAPDKYHATVETSSGNSVKSEVILLAGMAFARTAGGTWRGNR